MVRVVREELQPFYFYILFFPIYIFSKKKHEC